MKAISSEIQESTRRKKREAVPRALPAKAKNIKRNYLPGKTKAPASSNPEIPILSILSRSPASGMPTAAVLREVREKWYPALDAEDLSAIYPESRKKVVDTVVKFARKHLVAKGQVYAPSEENPVGTWHATSKGIERAFTEREGWLPRYVEVHSLIVYKEREEAEDDR